MTLPVVVRRATEADLPRLVELLQQLSLDDAREESGPALDREYHDAFREVDSDPRQHLLVVESEGSIAGTATVVIVPNLSYLGRPYAIAENIVVGDSRRGAGYGRELMRRVIDLAREAGCYRLSLTSNKRRTDAHRFYERLGFKATHEGFQLRFQ